MENERRVFTANITTLREEKSKLETAYRMSQRRFEEEKEESLCGMCLESQRDAISLPCLH
jgi:hypothetical protein